MFVVEAVTVTVSFLFHVTEGKKIMKPGRFRSSFTAVGCGIVLTMSLAIVVASEQPFEKVSDAEAALVQGGTCGDAGAYTCGEKKNQDEDCTSASCLHRADLYRLEVTDEDQQKLSQTVCGVEACGEVHITQDCH